MEGQVYENSYFRVLDHGNGEIHVIPKSPKHSMIRLTSEHDGTVITTHGKFELTTAVNVPAVKVK